MTRLVPRDQPPDDGRRAAEQHVAHRAAAERGHEADNAAAEKVHALDARREAVNRQTR